jgi:PAS domain S-box-containing protein
MFIQMLAIALLLGFVMFYLLAKVVEYPLVQLKKNLDEVLSNKVDHVQTSIRSQALHDVLVNINSLVSRGGVSGGPQLLEHSGINENEIRNIIKIMGFPGLLINKMGMILEINPQFEALTGYSAMQLFNQNIVAIPDQALQKNLQELIKKSGAQPQVTVNDQIEISSMMLSIQCQALGQSNGQPEFYLISFAPLTESQGGAA